MKSLAVLVLMCGIAAAAPIAPPAGWELDKTLATPPPGQRFGGATTRLAVYAYRAPGSGAVLYVNRAEADVAGAERDRIATIELEEPRNALRRQGSNAKAEQDSQRFDAATKQLEGVVSWKDATVGVSDRSRIVIAADATKLVAVTGQCVLAIDAPADVVNACEGALATLDPEIAAGARVALSIVATASEPPPKPHPDVLDDGARLSLPPIHVDPPAPDADRRPVYVGAGLVVMAALFYWNRRRREKFESDRGGGDVEKVTTVGKPDRRADEDADDLHAAAEAGDDGERK